MEEMKTELSRARTHSARLREEVQIMRTGLEKEQQKHKKTLKELEELRSLHETLMEKGKYEKHLMETRLKELDTTIKHLEEELLAEKSEKEVFREEMTRLRELCDQLDEAKTQTDKDLCVVKEILDKVSEENKQLLKKLSDYNNNILNKSIFRDGVHFISRQEEIGVADRIPNGNPARLSLMENGDITTKFQKHDTSAKLLDETRKDLARVTKERDESKQRCEELEKQLEETLVSLERQRTVSFHDRATSPGEPMQLEFDGKSSLCNLHFL